MDHFKIDQKNLCQESPPEFSGDWLASRIRLLFSAYRKDDYQDPEGFVAQLGINLRRYPAEIVGYVTDPVTGIQARSKWPPALSEIIEACEAEKAHRAKIAHWSNMPPPLQITFDKRRAEKAKLPACGFWGDGGKGTVWHDFKLATEKHGRPICIFEK